MLEPPLFSSSSRTFTLLLLQLTGQHLQKQCCTDIQIQLDAGSFQPLFLSSSETIFSSNECLLRSSTVFLQLLSRPVYLSLAVFLCFGEAITLQGCAAIGYFLDCGCLSLVL